MRFCPKCGKKGIKGRFCIKCTDEMNPLQNVPKDLSIKICPESKTFKFKNKWTPYKNLKETITVSLQKYFPEKNTKIIPIIGDIYQNPGIKQQIDVEIEKSKNEIYSFPVQLEFTICPKLSKKGSQYYEGILQLRKPRDEIIEFIRKEAKKQENRGIHLNKESFVKNGVDFFFTSQRYIQLLGDKLQNTFGGKLKKSPQLFSKNKQTSKELYRVNVFYEPPEFIKGDVIKIVDKTEKIIKVKKTGKNVTGTELTTGKNMMAEYKNKEIKILKKNKTTISKIFPNIEILDPSTFQPTKIQNKLLKKKYFIGQDVKTVSDEGRWWIIE